jgi:hypothetical protein
MPAVIAAAGLFPPQAREWCLPAEVPLTPRAAERLSREAAVQGFDNAGQALSIDWHRDIDGKQVERWSQKLGATLTAERDRDVLKLQEGQHPPDLPSDPPLLVIEVDGGRWQGREANPQTHSRWREDKVCAIATYLPGDGKEREPQRLLTTYTATVRNSDAFDSMCRLEAERRGLRQAEQVIALADGGNWIDPLLERQFHSYVRIIDWRHAQEHLYDCAKAALGEDSPERVPLAKRMEKLLWNGRVKKVIAILTEHAQRLGPPTDQDGPDHPRRVLHQNVGYFTRHQQHMNYPEYRKRGWPIGSGVVEAGVKQFNKRVKGTDQFWNEAGIEPILSLRALWISQDDRWTRYWASRTAYSRAA